VTLQAFPADWATALVLVAHPDDPEYGMAAAVAKWTSSGRTVVYALASSGERGIEGMEPERCGPLREGEQRRSAAIVGVHDVRFWGFPDSDIRNCAELRARIAATIAELAPDVVLTCYGGPEWASGQPNQRDHMEFAAAVLEAYDGMADPPRLLVENGPDATHGEIVDGFTEAAVASLAAHRAYLEVLDPDTAVEEQARTVVDEGTAPHPDFGGRRTLTLNLLRERSE
jgi:LmbE family N-acetylglucosaminyl deacetylase